MNRPAAGWSASLVVAAALACGGSTQELVTPSAGRCQMSLGTPASLPSAATQITAQLGATRDCVWTIQNPATWLQIDPMTGQGPVMLTLTAAENPMGRNRSATLVINDQQFNVVQDAAPCRFEVSPPALTLEHQGGRALLQVFTLDGCSWTTHSSQPWLRVVTGSGGDAGGTVELAVDSNTGPERSALLTLATLIVPVTQHAGPNDRTECRFSLSPGSRSIPASGGTGSFSVSTLPNCAWSAASNQPWIVIISGANVIGSGPVTYRVDPNPLTSVRSGAISAGTRQHVVRQDAAPRP